MEGIMICETCIHYSKPEILKGLGYCSAVETFDLRHAWIGLRLAQDAILGDVTQKKGLIGIDYVKSSLGAIGRGYMLEETIVDNEPICGGDSYEIY